MLDGSAIKITAARGSVPRSFVARPVATLAAKNPTRQGLVTPLRSAAADLQTRPCRLGYARRRDLRFRSALLLSVAPLSAPAALAYGSGREVMTALRAVMAFSLATLGASAGAVLAHDEQDPTRQGLDTPLRSAAADLQTRSCRLGFARRHDLRFRSALLLAFAPLSAPVALAYGSGREVMTALRAVMAFSLATLGASAIAMPVNH